VYPRIFGGMFNIEQDLHMAEGEGQYSYTKNSRRQVIILSHLLQFTSIRFCMHQNFVSSSIFVAHITISLQLLSVGPNNTFGL
jgi:hypothetical protein